MIKRCFELNDINYGTKLNFYGKGGILKHNKFKDLFIIEINEIAQEAIENTCIYNDNTDTFIISKKALEEYIENKINDFASDVITTSLIYAESNINDDKELVLTDEEEMSVYF